MRDAVAPSADATGLRVVASGRSDATGVLAPERFRTAGVRDAYEIAHRVPETLNQLFSQGITDPGAVQRELDRRFAGLL